MQVRGFVAGAVAANIRKADRLDLGLIVSQEPAFTVGVFTTNRVKAAPVLLDMERLRGGRARAILVNSGIANACTGEQGMRAAEATAALAAIALGVSPASVLVASTGVIGQQLDPARFERAMPGLVSALSPHGLDEVSRAIMTTDTRPKTCARTIEVGGREVRLFGMAKGAGMIMPNMATMLAFVCTDAQIVYPELLRLVREGVEHSFNRISVDGDSSTNDTVLVMANGAAGNPWIDEHNPEGCALFREALHEIFHELALQIVADGEGATKLVTIRVQGARSPEEAESAARTIANSPLVKTAFFGQDANWGRIIAALGRSGCRFDPERVDIFFDEIRLVENGLGLGAAVEAAATEVLRRDRFRVMLDLKEGGESAEIYTCDFSIDYVKINADYRS
ncbi:MAG: bifunctional ornithine acetyltransferase/N-acetylglutamate synthase [Desulfobulbaceae bacterium A2]|nr:MAG: bifunctional ornithine acetyltransferase/N-acetylglutamate synthase [Desulfobulbaceae bacterium A2]